MAMAERLSEARAVRPENILRSIHAPTTPGERSE